MGDMMRSLWLGLSLIFAGFSACAADEAIFERKVPMMIRLTVYVAGGSVTLSQPASCQMEKKLLRNGWVQSGRDTFDAPPIEHEFADGSGLIIDFPHNVCNWEVKSVRSAFHHTPKGAKRSIGRILANVRWVDNMYAPREVEILTPHRVDGVPPGHLLGVDVSFEWDIDGDPEGADFKKIADRFLETGEAPQEKSVQAFKRPQVPVVVTPALRPALKPYLALRNSADACKAMELGFFSLPLVVYEDYIWRRNEPFSEALSRITGDVWLTPERNPALFKGLAAVQEGKRGRPNYYVDFGLLRLLMDRQKEGKETALPYVWPRYDADVWLVEQRTRNERFFKVSDQPLVSRNSRMTTYKKFPNHLSCTAPLDALPGREIVFGGREDPVIGLKAHLAEPHQKIWFYEAGSRRLFQLTNATATGVGATLH